MSSSIPKSNSRKRPQEDDGCDKTAKKFKCEPCNKYFKEHKSLLRHERENSKHRWQPLVSSSSFTCELCPKTFARAHDLERHFKEQHLAGKVPCSICSKRVRPKTPHKNADGLECVTKLDARSHVTAAFNKYCGDEHGSSTASYVTNREQGFPDDFHNNSTDDRDNGVCESVAQECDVEPNLIKLDLSRPQGIPEHARHSIANSILELGNQPTPFTPTKINTMDMVTYKKQVRTKRVGSLLPCGICYHDFEVNNIDMMAQHLVGHFRRLDGEYRCEICEVSFVSKVDLNRHEYGAARGDCGFRFPHRAACPGHHKPQRQDRECTSMVSDDDRFDFMYRLRTWERWQLKTFVSSLTPLVDSRIGGSRGSKSIAWTENLPRDLVSDRGGPRSEAILAGTGWWRSRRKKTAVTEYDSRHSDPPDQKHDLQNTIEPTIAAAMDELSMADPDDFFVSMDERAMRDLDDLFADGGKVLVQVQDRDDTFGQLYSRQSSTCSTPTKFEVGDVEDNSGTSGLSQLLEDILFQAIRSSDLDMAALAIAGGADIQDFQTFSGIGQETPLHLACLIGDMRLIVLLMEAGAVIRKGSVFGDDPWTVALKEGHFDAARLMIHHGAIESRSLNIASFVCSMLPSMKIYESSLHEKIQFLIDLEASVDGEDVEGNTALELVASIGDLDSVRLLLKNGAKVNHIGQLGDALLCAISGRHFEVAERLVRAGASVSGWNLIGAIEIGARASIIDALLEVYIEPTPADFASVLAVAVDKRLTDVVET